MGSSSKTVLCCVTWKCLRYKCPVICTVWVFTHCSKINTEWQKGKSDGFFHIASLLCTYSSLLNVLFLVRAGLESPCCMTYISLVKSLGKTPGCFTAPTSVSCVTMSSLGLFVCHSCELDVLWTCSRGLHLGNFGREEGSPLHSTLLSCRSCNFLGQPPCTSALQLVPRSHGSLENSFDPPGSPKNKDLCGSSSKTRHQNPC